MVIGIGVVALVHASETPSRDLVFEGFVFGKTCRGSVTTMSQLMPNSSISNFAPKQCSSAIILDLEHSHMAAALATTSEKHPYRLAQLREVL